MFVIITLLFGIMAMCSCDQIILAVRKIMLETPSLDEIIIPKSSKLTVCGDVHGRLTCKYSVEYQILNK